MSNWITCIQPFLWMVTAIFLVLSLRNYVKTQRLLWKMILFQGRLLDFVAAKMGPGIFGDYLAIKEAGPDADIRKITLDQTAGQHVKLRKGLLESIEREKDPIEKTRLQEMLKEIDGVFTVMSTLDPESSPDYVSRVMVDVDAAMQRIAVLRRGDE